jgi:photosystem II stability/assembly factor-like uncharacterized protein
MIRSSLWMFGLLLLLLMSTPACMLIGRPTPTAPPIPTSTSTPLPDPTTISPTQQPTFEPTAPIIEIDLSEPTDAIPAVLTSPQPAAPAHFKAGESISLDKIVMKSRIEGWGISGQYVLTTIDGGQTWREATPLESFAPGSKVQAYGAFLDIHSAWIIFAPDGHINPNAAVWHTTDSGRNWIPSPPLNHQAFGDRVWAEFAVLDAQNVWLMVRGVYVGAGTHFDHELFHSTDGGLTWIPLPGEMSDDYTGMVFANPKFGLRTLQTTGAYAAAPPAYEVTNDGGVVWENHELPPPPGVTDLFTQYPYCETYQPIVLSTHSFHILVGCVDYGDPPRRFISYFYSSQDGGATWKSVKLPAKVQASQDQLIYFGMNNILILGRETYISTSNGQTWTFVKMVNWDGQFSFNDPEFGWAIARSNGDVALVHTVNGARIWKIIKPTIAR